MLRRIIALALVAVLVGITPALVLAKGPSGNGGGNAGGNSGGSGAGGVSGAPGQGGGGVGGSGSSGGASGSNGNQGGGAGNSAGNGNAGGSSGGGGTGGGGGTAGGGTGGGTGNGGGAGASSSGAAAGAPDGSSSTGGDGPIAAPTGRGRDIYTAFAVCRPLVMHAHLTRALPDGQFSFEADTSYDAGVIARCLEAQNYTFDFVWVNQNFAPTVAQADQDDTAKTAAARRRDSADGPDRIAEEGRK